MKCKYETSNGRCGLKGSYAYRHKCFTDDLCKCCEPQTNADRIRAMSDEELADLLDDFGACSRCRRRGNDCFPVSKTLDWLRKPVKDSEGDV